MLHYKTNHKMSSSVPTLALTHSEFLSRSFNLGLPHIPPLPEKTKLNSPTSQGSYKD